jgi:hypothetical protein
MMKIIIPWLDGAAGFLSVVELPAPGAIRWVARRKAQVVAAVNGGLLTAGDACGRYRLTPEELTSWQNAYRRYGMRGLLTTRFVREMPLE